MITREGKTTLAPAYDFISSGLAFLSIGRDRREVEETALPLAGKKKRLERTHWIDYLAHERLDLTEQAVESLLNDLREGYAEWEEIIRRSFLPDGMQERFQGLIFDRVAALEL